MLHFIQHDKRGCEEFLNGFLVPVRSLFVIPSVCGNPDPSNQEENKDSRIRWE